MKKKSNLTLFMKQLIRSLKEEERFSTAHIYQSTLNAFMLFCKTDAIRFNQMERSRLKQFENHLWGIERSGFFNGREKWVKGFENQMV